MTVIPVSLPFAKVARGLTLNYCLKPCPLTQSRFAGRLLLEPIFDLSAYRCSAVVDWVEFLMRVDRPTQFKAIQHVLQPIMHRTVYVNPPKGGNPYSSQRFLIRLQDPTPDQVDACHEALRRRFTLCQEIRVDEVEIAVDFRARSHSDTDRQLMVGLLQRHFVPPAKFMSSAPDKPRTVFGTGKGSAIRLIKDYDRVEEPPFINGTLVYGERYAPVTYRIMDKTTDSRRSAGVAVELPQHDRRARIEVTLQREALSSLGIETHGDLRAFPHEKLRKLFFGFFLPTLREAKRDGDAAKQFARDYLDQRYRETFQSLGAYGLLRKDHILTRSRQLVQKSLPADERVRVDGLEVRYRLCEHGYLMAYAALNKLAWDALARMRI